MANLLPTAETPRGDAAESYAKRDNIGVPGATSTDTGLATVDANAATRATDRTITPKSPSGTFQPDTADYSSDGSGRGAAAA